MSKGDFGLIFTQFYSSHRCVEGLPYARHLEALKHGDEKEVTVCWIINGHSSAFLPCQETQLSGLILIFPASLVARAQYCPNSNRGDLREVC